MTTLRKCWPILLLLTGCETTQIQQQPTQHYWLVTCDPQTNNIAWQVNNKRLPSTTNSVLVTAPAGQVVKCWTTDGHNNSTTNQITLK